MKTTKIENQKADEERTSLISGDQWVSSLKCLGITTRDAICELVDNSLDAGAKNIHVSVLEPDNKKITFLVEDDGYGIEDGKIDKILAFGGRRQLQKNTIGKFGWGLSSSITCQTNRGEVYSKTKKDKNYKFCYIDLDELQKDYMGGNPILPLVSEKDPWKEYPLRLKSEKHGTVVVLKNCNVADLDWHNKNKIVTELMKTLGETYRKYIAGGIKFYVEGTELKPIDPLLLMMDTLYVKKYEKSKEYRNIEIKMEEVIDPDTNEPARIRIKLAMLKPSIAEVRNIEKDIKHGMANQGFYLMRHDRQIARAITLGIYTRNAHYNFLRGEISFPACLDSYFGIQTNKCRYSLKEGLSDKFNEAMKGVIPQMDKEYWEEKTKFKQMLERHKIKESERIAAEAIKVMKKTEIELAESEIKKNEDLRKKERDDNIKRLELDESVKDEDKQVIKKEIENEFQRRMPFRMKLKHVETGDFYLVKPIGNNEVEVHLNTAHPFYQKVYERAQEKGISDYIDLLIFTLAKAEMDYWDTETKKFYDMQKSVWSSYLTTFLSYAVEAHDPLKEGTSEVNAP